MDQSPASEGIATATTHPRAVAHPEKWCLMVLLFTTGFAQANFVSQQKSQRSRWLLNLLASAGLPDSFFSLRRPSARIKSVRPPSAPTFNKPPSMWPLKLQVDPEPPLPAQFNHRIFLWRL